MRASIIPPFRLCTHPPTHRICLGIPMFAVYVVGIPAVILYLLNKNHHQLNRPDVKRKYFFLYTGYEREWWFWEVLVAIRKLSLVAVTVFWQYSVELQVRWTWHPHACGCWGGEGG
jgi:hypothetical protein